MIGFPQLRVLIRRQACSYLFTVPKPLAFGWSTHER